MITTLYTVHMNHQMVRYGPSHLMLAVWAGLLISVAGKHTDTILVGAFGGPII